MPYGKSPGGRASGTPEDETSAAETSPGAARASPEIVTWVRFHVIPYEGRGPAVDRGAAVCANPMLPAYNVVDIDVVRKVKLIRQDTQFGRLNFPVPPMKTRWAIFHDRYPARM